MYMAQGGYMCHNSERLKKILQELGAQMLLCANKGSKQVSINMYKLPQCMVPYAELQSIIAAALLLPSN